MRGAARYKQTPGYSVSAYSAKLDTGFATYLAGARLDMSMWRRTLLVQPHVLVAIAIVGAVHHDGDALYIGLPARALAAVEDDRPRDVFLKLLVDFPHQLLALGDVGLLGLLVEQLLDVGIAVIGIVSLRLAGVILVE